MTDELNKKTLQNEEETNVDQVVVDETTESTEVVEATTEETAEEIAEVPAEEIVSEVVEATTEETAEEIAEVPAEEIVSEVVESTTEEKSEPAVEEAAYEAKSYTGEISERVYTLAELQEASEDYTDDEYDVLAKMYEGTLSTLKEKEIVTGRIISLDDKYVIVDIGFKSEGIVPVNEFRNADTLKPGDEIEVFLDRVEDRDGQLVLSRKKADTLRVWQKIDSAHNNQTVIEGLIKRRIKGGMVVDIFGIDAFLPGSQIDVRPVRDFDAYVGKTMEFMVVKLNTTSENVVVSHRALVETDLEEQKEEILATMDSGQILRYCQKYH